jgi:hypothetical protein
LPRSIEKYRVEEMAVAGGVRRGVERCGRVVSVVSRAIFAAARRHVRGDWEA